VQAFIGFIFKVKHLRMVMKYLKLKKFKVVKSASKVMGQKSVLLVDSKQQAATFNAGAYCTILEQLRAAIKQKCPGLLIKGVLLLHDNAWPHNANATQLYFWLEILEHPVYSPDLAPSNYYLFPALKDHLGGHKFKKDDDAQVAVR
jgi:histone-lysine N-methyltransferase SETMAR